MHEARCRKLGNEGVVSLDPPATTTRSKQSQERRVMNEGVVQIYL